MKRFISILIAVSIIIGMIPVTVQATEGDQIEVDNGNMTVEGTNSFGSLLSEEIMESQNENDAAAEEYEEGYSILDLEIEGNIATVSYSTLESANLVVAIYTEDGIQLVTSGTTKVDPEETIATVILEGEMPTYFMVSAYLLDCYDMSPLCVPYDTPMYTKDMQELLASTVDDYDTDRVFNLDNNDTTNFAVYSEDTIVIDQVEGVNTIVEIDDENATYRIEEADENITSLQEGDIFVYPYCEEDTLIVKVASIDVDNATVTITGAELELEEVFSAVKVEGESYTEEMSVDDSTATEGITYEGVEADENCVRAIEGSGSANASHKFNISIKEEAESEELDASLSVSGTLKFQISAQVKYYISSSSKYLEFKATPKISASISVEGSITEKLSLGSFGVSPIAGVYIGFEPKLEMKFTGKVEFSATLSATIGVKYDNKTGIQNISSLPKVSFNLSVEGTVFLGIDFGPKVTILGDKVAKLQMSSIVGVELTGSLTGAKHEIGKNDAPSHHTCQECLQIDVEFQAKLSGEIKFLNAKWLTIPFDIVKWTVPLGEVYYSFDHDELGAGSCPYKEYRVTFLVKNEDGSVAPDISIMDESGESWGTTNRKGVAIKYVPEGLYTITMEIGGKTIESTLSITKETKVTITSDGKVSVNNGTKNSQTVFDYIKSGNYENIIDNGEIPAPDIYLEDMEIVNSGRYTGNMGDSFINLLGTNNGTTDIHGNELEHGLEAWIARWNFRNELSWAWAEYELNGAYRNLTGKLTVISDCYNKKNFDSTIEIIGDGVVLYSENLKPNMEVSTLNVDVTGVKTLRIYVYDNTAVAGGTSFGLWDFGLHKCNDASDSENLSECLIENVDVNYLAEETVNSEEDISGDIFSRLSVHGGKYETDVMGNYVLKTATFSDLVPEKEYVLLALASIDAEELLAADNLLYIEQGTAEEDGTLSFQYAQRVDTSVAYVVVTGATDCDLNDAEITFPEIISNGVTDVINPTIIYNGEELVENQDYVILGNVDYTDPGEYICYIRGIYNYTGLVKCKYVIYDESIKTLQCKMEDKNVQMDDVFTIDIEIINNPGIISLNFDLIYDTNVLELQNIEDMQILNGFITPESVCESPCTLQWKDSVEAIDNIGQGKIVSLTFRALQVTSSTEVKIVNGEVRNFSGEEVPFSSQVSTIEIKEKPVDVIGVELNKNTLLLNTGESEILTATINPSDASNKNIEWKSDNESIATVSNTGEVLAIKEGKTIITVTTEDGHFSTNCEVNVKCGHSSKREIPSKNPDCINTGNNKYYICSECEKIFKEDGVTESTIEGETLEALGHDFSEETVIEEATCTEEGSKSIHCSRCDEIEEIQRISAIGHSWDEGTVTKEATCTEEGILTYKCILCKETKTESIPVIEHNWNTYYTIDKPATCTEEGRKSIHCRLCSEVKETQIIPASGHSWDEGTVTKEATCKEEGILTYKCIVCKGTKTESIPATEHNWNIYYTIDKRATCTEEGRKSIHCRLCNDVKNITEIPATGHTFVTDPAVAATYTSTGKTEGSHCSVCGVVFKKQETIPVLTGLAPAQNGVRNYYENGTVKKSLTTLIKDKGTWYYVEEGVVSGKYTGLVKYNGSWFYIKNSKVDFSYTGLCKHGSSWYYVKNGVLNWKYTGLCKYGTSWYYVENGVLNWNYTGLCKYNGSWYYVGKGVVNFKYTGLCKYGTSWYYVKNGVLNWKYTGLCKYGTKWYYVQKGVLNWKYTGLCKYGSNWYYVKNGVLNWKYTGLCKYGNKWYYVQKGVLNWKYTGYTNYAGSRWYVKNGVMVKKG